MLELHQFPPAFGLPNASPFCMKVEAFLRMNDIDYKVVNLSDPRKAPKGKCPFIMDADKTVADSSEIIRYLIDSRKLEDGLTADQHAHGHLLQRTLEENLYWCLLQERWMDDDNWAVMKKVVFAGMPGAAAAVVSRMVRAKTKRDLIGHGMGRHEKDEINFRAGEDIAALAQCLGEKPFLFGDRPSRFDACALAFVSGAVRVPLRSSIGELVGQHPRLLDYTDRLMNQYFADFPAN